MQDHWSSSIIYSYVIRWYLSPHIYIYVQDKITFCIWIFCYQGKNNYLQFSYICSGFLLCVCGHVRAWVSSPCGPMWRPEIDMRVPFSIFFYLIFWDRVFQWTRSLLFQSVRFNYTSHLPSPPLLLLVSSKFVTFILRSFKLMIL